MTITTTSAQAQRIATAVGNYLNLGRDATAVEAKAFVIDSLKEIVIGYERRILEAEAKANMPSPQPFDPT